MLKLLVIFVKKIANFARILLNFSLARVSARANGCEPPRDLRRTDLGRGVALRVAARPGLAGREPVHLGWRALEESGTTGLQKRMRVEFKFRTYLNCRTYTVPWTFELTTLKYRKSEDRCIFEIPKTFGQNLAKLKNSGKPCKIL